MRNSGASEAKGATHWTSRNSSTPISTPAPMRLSANGSAVDRTAPAANRISAPIVIRLGRVAMVPSVSAGPTRCGSSTGALAMSHR